MISTARLNYAGPSPVDDADIETRLQGNATLLTGPTNRTDAASSAHDAALLKAAKSYVDTQDQTFALDSYMTDRDALNVPLAVRGVANGVATLDGTSKIPLAQMPIGGVGYALGPFGPTAVNPGQTDTTPIKVASFNIGVQSIPFRPLAYGIGYIGAAGQGRPVIKAMISNGDASFAGGTLIGEGMGRTLFNDFQTVPIVPTVGGPGGTGFASSYNIWINFWLLEGDGKGTVTFGGTGLASACVFLLRTAQ